MDASAENYLERELHERLRSDPAIFEFLEAGSLDGVWYWDLEEPENEWLSARFWEVLGCDPKDKQHLASEWQDLIHPDDLKAALENFEKHCADPEYPYDQTVRYRHADGSTVWVRCRGMAIRDETGKPVRMLGAHNDVTALKVAEAKLSAELSFSADLYRGLGRTLPMAVFYKDLEGRFRHVNNRFCEVIGRKEEQVVGRTDYDLFDKSVADQFRAADRRVVESGEVFHAIEANPEPGSGVRYIEVFKNVVLRDGKPDGVHGVFWDVTERMAAEAETRLTAFGLERATVAFYLIDNEANILRVNEANCEMLGYSREELTRMTIHDVNPEFPPAAWLGHWDELREKRHMFFESKLRAKDGREFPVEIEINFLEFDGKEYNFAFVRDISDRVRAAKEREEMERSFQEAQKLESLGVLAGGIAHDFNNLLTAMLGNVSLMKMELPTDSDHQELLTDVENAAIRAADLCRQMLAYAGKGRFVIRQVNLTDVVREMVSLLQVSICKNARLDLRLDEDLPGALADAAQINQVVMNLVINASEALGDREGVITLATGSLQADAAYLADNQFADSLEPGEYVFLEVGDDGAGMDAATRARIFEPFFSTKFTGRGLGLAAVLGIIRGHKGALRVYSEPDSGTTFKILLPVADAEAAQEETNTKPPTVVSESSLVLVIDDEEPVRRTARRVLESAGHRVLVANDGVAGVACFTDHRDEIRAVLLDLTMPRMDGVETFRRLRQLRPEIPVLLTSGYNEQAAIQRFTGKGLAGFVQKPFTAENLLQQIAKVLGKQTTG